MELQDAVTQKIVGALASDTGQIKKSSYSEAWSKDAAGLEEYDYYLRGHDKFMQYTPEAMEEAFRIWSEGMEKFPDSSLLKFKMGFLRYTRAVQGWSKDSEEDFLEVGKLARKGMANNNLSPLENKMGHWLMAYSHLAERDFQNALREAETAMALAPNDAYMASVLAEVPLAAGDIEKAVAWADFGIRNDPANGFNYFIKGWVLSVGGRYAESNKVMEGLGDWLATAALVRSINAVNLGKPNEAKAHIEKSLAIDPSWTAEKWRAPPPSLATRCWTDRLPT
jgi:tetratricopeptide (TPR) repeat protein